MIQSYQLTFALASKNDFPKNGSTSCILLRVRRSNRYLKIQKEKKQRLDQQIIRLAIIETTFLTTHANLFPQNLSYLKLLTHESLWNLFVRFTTTARLEEDIPRSEHILYIGQFNASSQETYTASCWTTAGDRKNLFEVGPNFSERDRNDGHVLVPLWRDNTFATPTHERERERDGKRRGRRTICPVASINFQFRDCLPRGTSASLNWKRSGDERSEKVELPWISIDEFDLFDAVGKVAIMTRIN